MKTYRTPEPEIWQGRKTESSQYLHEVVEMLDLESGQKSGGNGFTLLGYACDEGVRRNLGRIGARTGPMAIKRELGKLPCPVSWESRLLDAGELACEDQDMEGAQADLGEAVKNILDTGLFPIVLGGGHDMAFGHYMGLRDHLGHGPRIGIINMDAHFDLRSNTGGNNSGTPFYQIALECKHRNQPFDYLCLGIREEANPPELFDTAEEFGVTFIPNTRFNLENKASLIFDIRKFMSVVDHVYLTIDLDGFSSAYAPGVSAASPFGFIPEIALMSFREILNSGKLVSVDFAEMNPLFDRDQQTAKLAAGLVHHVLRRQELG